MKKIFSLLAGMLFAVCTFAQKNIDLSIQLLSPAANTTYNNLMPGDSMVYAYVITNNGTDAVTGSDTLFIFTDLNPMITPQGYASILTVTPQIILPGTSDTIRVSYHEGDPFASWFIHFPVDNTVATWVAVCGKSEDDLPFNDPGYNSFTDIWDPAFSLADLTGNNVDTNQQISFVSPQVESLDVSVYNNQPAVINTLNGSLQLQATILPANASQDVTWSLSPSGLALISGGNFATVSAIANGTVWAKATSVANPAMTDSILITISAQTADSIVVATTGGTAAVINTPSGTLQLQSDVFPAGYFQGVAWFITPVDGAATITSQGLVTAVADGTVWAKAVSLINPFLADSLMITIAQASSIPDIAQLLGLQIFPNPANDAVTVSVRNRHAPLSLVVTDVKGSILASYNFRKNGLQTPLAIPLKQWAPGIYFLQMKGKDIQYTGRIMKQ